MKDLRIFVSYSHDDETIATALTNLLQQAFGPGLEEAFLDKRAITFGSGIRASITEALENADLLIAIITDAEPASSLSWPGYEIGTFSAYWNEKHYKDGIHKNRERGTVVGRVVILNNGKIPLGPEEGNRSVNLGIPEELLADSENESNTAEFRKSALADYDLLTFLREIENLLTIEPDYSNFFKARKATLDDLVVEFKVRAFLELKRKVRDVSKPRKQLIVRCRGAMPSHQASDLPDDTRLISAGGASNVFGKSEQDASLFKRSIGAAPGVERYETTWGRFRASVKDHQYGAYWCGVIEQAVCGARTGGAELDTDLVLISSKDQRYRIVATTITTYFNTDTEISLYLIEGLKRHDRGDTMTSDFLNCLILVCRFRFAFLEGASPFYWLNFESSSAFPQAKAKDLLMELDYLKSEAIHANLDKPGAWEGLISTEQLTEMMKVWREIDLELRKASNAVIGQGADTQNAGRLTTHVVAQLKRIFDEIRPFNTLLGAAVMRRLLVEFDRDSNSESKRGT